MKLIRFGAGGQVSKGAGVIITALSPRPSPSGRAATSLPVAARALIEGATRAGVPRLIVVGGAGSLAVAPGVRLHARARMTAAY